MKFRRDKSRVRSADVPELACTSCRRKERATSASWFAWPDAENARLWVFEPYIYLCNTCLAIEVLDNPDRWRCFKRIKPS